MKNSLWFVLASLFIFSNPSLADEPSEEKEEITQLNEDKDDTAVVHLKVRSEGSFVDSSTLSHKMAELLEKIFEANPRMRVIFTRKTVINNDEYEKMKKEIICHQTVEQKDAEISRLTALTKEQHEEIERLKADKAQLLRANKDQAQELTHLGSLLTTDG